MTEDVIDAVDTVLSTRNNVELTNDLADTLQKLWAHSAIQHAFEVRNIICVPDSTEHFMSSFDRITDPNYVPTDEV